MLRSILEVDNSISGRYGLEFEVEGERLPNLRTDSLKTVPDGSLRGGVEYVWKRPLNKEDSLAVLDYLNNKLEDAEVKFSFRTSTHVHINVLDLNQKDLLKFLYTLYLVEPCLVHFSGEGRKGNRFCLGLLDAEAIAYLLQELFATETPSAFFRFGRRHFETDVCKYSAINIAPMFYQGSIEVRTLRGTLDRGVIDSWLTTFDNIFEFINKFEDWRSIERSVVSKGFMSVLDDIFGHDFDRYVGASTFNALSEQMKTLIVWG